MSVNQKQKSQLYYVEELDYELNLYYLAKLQLFWSHRQILGYKILKTIMRDSKSFIKNCTQLSEEKVITSKIQEEFEITLVSFREKVDNYKKLTYAQQRFLKQIKFKIVRKGQEPNELKNTKKQQQEQEKQIKHRKKFLSYHKLLRCKNSILKIKSQLQQQQNKEEAIFQFKNGILSILNYLRPDILINSEEKERIENVENTIVNYLNSSQRDHNSSIIILEELGILMQQQNFLKLYSLVCQEKKKQNQQSNKKTLDQEEEYEKKNDFILKYEQSQSAIKMSQSDVTYFDDFNEEAIYFPEFFKTALTKSELTNSVLKRPKMKNQLFHEEFQCSAYLNKVLNENCNQQQKLSIIVLLQYLFQSQCLGAQGIDDDTIYEPCFVVQFFIILLEEVMCYVRHKVAVQILSKNQQKKTKIR